MATGPTPPTIPPAEPGTPPSKWSEYVLASSPAKDTPATLPETPGRESGPDTTKEKLQGQAPKELEKQQAQPSGESKQTTARDQPTIGETAAQTVKQYVPRKTVEYVTQTAAAAAAIPQGIKNTVTSYLSSEEKNKEPHVSLPSTELKGAQPSEHTGGVGALPGNLSESSVALLPDERQERIQERRPTSPRPRRDTIKPSAAGGDELRECQRVEETKTSRDATLSRDEAVAPRQSISPATNAETRAEETIESNITARSGPEVGSQKVSEAKGEEALGKQEKTEAVAAVGTVGTAPDAGEPSETEKDVRGSHLASETPGKDKGSSQDVQGGGNEERQTAPTGKVEEGYGEEYHPAHLHPPPPGASVAEYQVSVGTQQQGQDLPATRAGKRASVSGERKPGLMTMVKGEMKILAGKMSGDEHKVEEGRKIVHGQV